MGNAMNLIGERFGRLVVIERAGTDASGHTAWKCKCDCGNEKIARGSHLKVGYIKSCGCLVIDTLRDNSTKHGLEHTRIYRIWQGMRLRCYNEKSNRFHRYGGRGITICDEWKNNIQSFYDWAMSSGYREDLTIDRIDNDKGYSPENCRWVTIKEQMNHTSKNRHMTINGVKKTIAEWAEESGMNYSTLYTRIITNGWSLERALTEPVKQGRSDIE